MGLGLGLALGWVWVWAWAQGWGWGQDQQFPPQNSSRIPACHPTSLGLTKLAKPSHLAAKLASQEQ